MSTGSIAIADTNGRLLQCTEAVLPIYSLAKPFIASSVFSTGVNIDAPVSNWIDEQVCPSSADISVAQLLNHTSGLMDYFPLPDYQAAIRSGATPWSDEEFIERTLRKPLLFSPGERWSYSNPGYWLLSQIVQKQTGLDFDAVIQEFIATPLGLSSIHVAHGQFADDLPWYSAQWVWHGVIMSNALDVVKFMRSELVKPLLSNLTPVPVEHPLWTSPHSSYGLMVEPGVRYGHNGDGPGYSASCFHFIESGLTGCVLMPADKEGVAMEVLLEEIKQCH
ncbi:MAG: serine hydrolase domain-containing protein [Pseudomonadales bacterium]